MKTVLLYILIFCFLPFSSYCQNREADSLILVQVYEALNGQDWNNPENWLSTNTIDTWKGVFIENDRVVKLEIIFQDATGTFPTAITGLDQLHTFEIRSGSVSGQLPEELNLLTKLKRFGVGGLGLSGDILNIWSDFLNLQTLILSNNSLAGNLPDLPESLNLLYIQQNELTGEIPQSWNNQNVTALQIQENQLTGSFNSFSTWENITSIDIGDNLWDSTTFPEWVDNLPNLQRFSCDNCNLYGQLPSSLDFSNSPNYRGMFISGNNLFGDISLLFNGLDSEEELYLVARENNFSGEFPAHKLSKSTRIDIRGNQYNTISEFEIEPGFELLDINYNNFTFTTLEPLKIYIDTAMEFGINYEYQNKLLTIDTFMTSASSIIINAGESYPNTEYQWAKNHINIEGENSSQLEILPSLQEAGDFYFCKMTHTNFPELELRRNSVLLSENIPINLENIIPERISIFPIPSNNTITINNTNDEKIVYYEIVNQLGQLLDKKTFDVSQQINISALPKGNYIVQIHFTTGFITKIITKL